MNIFVAIMLFFAALGLLDEILGGRLGLAAEFEKGLTTMGSLALSTIGFYCIGVAAVQANAEAIAAAAKNMPFDSSLLIGCLLAPDMGALPIALKLASSQALGIFTGALVAGGLGMTVGFQLPVFLAAVQKQEVGELMRGFIYGLITLPVGLLTGGFLLGLPVITLLLNMIPVFLLCVVLIIAFLLVPDGTMKVLTAFGVGIRILSFILFGIVIFGVFAPQWAMVDQELVYEMLYLIIRMVIVACGGLVISKLALQYFSAPIDVLGKHLGINRQAVIGLILSCTQSLAMLPLFSQMDRKGKILNAAFSVSGAYLVGGQMAFTATLIPPSAVPAYMINKAVAGALAVLLASLFERVTASEK